LEVLVEDGLVLVEDDLAVVEVDFAVVEDDLAVVKDDFVVDTEELWLVEVVWLLVDDVMVVVGLAVALPFQFPRSVSFSTVGSL